MKPVIAIAERLPAGPDRREMIAAGHMATRISPRWRAACSKGEARLVNVAADGTAHVGDHGWD